jgi:HPt (histidine-containing phosphotransfer) domain-containing protein
VDWDSALNSVGGKRDLLRDLVDIYLEEAPRLLRDARRAIDAADADALRIAAHTLKGSSRYFGRNRVEELAFHIEKIAARRETAGADAYWQQLQAALAELLPLLQHFEVNPTIQSDNAAPVEQGRE